VQLLNASAPPNIKVSISFHLYSLYKLVSCQQPYYRDWWLTVRRSLSTNIIYYLFKPLCAYEITKNIIQQLHCIQMYWSTYPLSVSLISLHTVRAFFGFGLPELLVETVCIVCPPEVWESTISALIVASYSWINICGTFDAGSQCVDVVDSFKLAIYINNIHFIQITVHLHRSAPVYICHVRT